MPTRLIIGVWVENFNVPSRTSNKLWTSTKASRKMEERSSYGKTGNKHDDVQVVLQPSSKRVIFFPALCPSKKSLLSLSSPSCQQRSPFTRETDEQCPRISCDSCHTTQCTTWFSTVNNSDDLEFLRWSVVLLNCSKGTFFPTPLHLKFLGPKKLQQVPKTSLGCWFFLFTIFL